MFKIKKLMFLLLVSIMVFSSAIVFADNVGVSEFPPIEDTDDNNSITPLGVGLPTTTINIKGKYSYFEGQAQNSNLYSNYYYTGSSTYGVVVTNKSSKPLKVQVRSSSKIYKTITVAANGFSGQTVTGMSANEKIYIVFHAPSHFIGHIEGK